MKFYRVETNGGFGCYTTGDMDYDCDRHNDNDTHPGYYQDKVLYDKIDDIFPYKFGFNSKKQLKKWFNTNEREQLQECEFKVSKYKIKKKYVVKSKTQMVFIPEHAELIKRIEVTDI